MSDFIPCQIKQLPPHLHFQAAMTAIRENALNRPHQSVVEPERIAVLTTKYWRSGSVNLTVGFMEPTSPALAQKIVSHMNAWAPRCNVKFALVSGAAAKAQVRISRGPGGYWSYLGVDVLSIPANEPTMNLEGFSLNTPDSEYRRVVRHETGHTLGCPHEHMRREIVARLDPAKTVAYFERTQGWSAQEVQQQVLTPIEESSLMGTPHADVASIMCYQLDGSITTDGQPIPGGNDIDEADYAFMGGIYPPVVVPPPPPPPPPPAGNWSIALPAGATLSGTGAAPVVKAS